MNKIRNVSLLAVAVSMAISGQVNAQRTTSAQIEEVVVTAQKREENMQDVAISMSAMDANMIQKTFSRTIDEITGMSPNLIINPILGNGTVGVSIRGMQHAEVEKSFDPAVAIYQDGVYLATTTGALLNVWDAERVEVLRGHGRQCRRQHLFGVLISVAGQLLGLALQRFEVERLRLAIGGAAIGRPRTGGQQAGGRKTGVSRNGHGRFEQIPAVHKYNLSCAIPRLSWHVLDQK